MPAGFEYLIHHLTQGDSLRLAPLSERLIGHTRQLLIFPLFELCQHVHGNECPYRRTRTSYHGDMPVLNRGIDNRRKLGAGFANTELILHTGKCTPVGVHTR